jgi:hypothetical protein
MERGKSQLADGKGFDSRTSRKKIAKIGVFLLPKCYCIQAAPEPFGATHRLMKSDRPKGSRAFQT